MWLFSPHTRHSSSLATPCPLSPPLQALAVARRVLSPHTKTQERHRMRNGRSTHTLYPCEAWQTQTDAHTRESRVSESRGALSTDLTVALRCKSHTVRCGPGRISAIRAGWGWVGVGGGTRDGKQIDASEMWP